MNNVIKNAVIRGAGLSFAIASVLFLFTSHIHIFALVPAGALIGFGMGHFRQTNPSAMGKLQDLPRTHRSRFVGSGGPGRFLLHPNFFIRLSSLALFGAGLLLITWCLSYYLLPENVFSGGAKSLMMRGALNTPSNRIFEEWGKIFRSNMLPVLLILGGNFLIRVNRIPLGYLCSLVNIAGYGLFIGTNSFAIPMPVRLAPSFAILERSGPYEMFALILLAAASFTWSRFEIKHLFRTNPERVIPASGIARFEIAACLFGIGILAAANWVEASMVIQAALPK